LATVLTLVKAADRGGHSALKNISSGVHDLSKSEATFSFLSQAQLRRELPCFRGRLSIGFDMCFYAHHPKLLNEATGDSYRSYNLCKNRKIHPVDRNQCNYKL
jgi:hypothetical protein